jgi:ubiquitin conjugation factor E4 B
MQDQRSKLHSQIFAYQVQLLDSNLIDRTIAFTTFSMAWLIRIADPVNSSKYPATPLTCVSRILHIRHSPHLLRSLPLPREVPDVFKMLPEYLIEDVIEFYLFLVRCVDVTVFMVSRH